MLARDTLYLIELKHVLRHTGRPAVLKDPRARTPTTPVLGGVASSWVVMSWALRSRCVQSALSPSYASGVQPQKRGRGRPAGSRVDPAERQTALLDAAERAIRAKGPSVGLVDIAAEAGFVRSAVYAVYPSREALLTALSKRTAGRLLAEITRRAAGSTDLRQRMALFFDVICGWIADEPEVHRALSGDPAAGVFEQLAAAVEAMLTSAFAADARSPAAAPWARAIVGSAVAAAEWWRRTGTMSRADLVEHLTALCWDGGAALPFLADDIKTIDSGITK